MQWRSPEKKWYLVQVERWIMSEVRKTGEFHTTYEEIQKRYPEMSHNLIEQIIRYMSNKEIVWCPVQPRSSAPVGVKRAVVFRIPDKKRGKKIKFYRWY
jgi:2-oxoglutarate dehydrogenase complex dehydrogenase (E1) component-like enzyme